MAEFITDPSSVSYSMAYYRVTLFNRTDQRHRPNLCQKAVNGVNSIQRRHLANQIETRDGWIGLQQCFDR